MKSKYFIAFFPRITLNFVLFSAWNVVLNDHQTGKKWKILQKKIKISAKLSALIVECKLKIEKNERYRESHNNFSAKREHSR